MLRSLNLKEKGVISHITAGLLVYVLLYKIELWIVVWSNFVKSLVLLFYYRQHFRSTKSWIFAETINKFSDWKHRNSLPWDIIVCHNIDVFGAEHIRRSNNLILKTVSGANGSHKRTKDIRTAKQCMFIILIWWPFLTLLKFSKNFGHKCFFCLSNFFQHIF